MLRKSFLKNVDKKSYSTKTKNSLLLGLASLVWGIAFVFQQIGGQSIGAYTFNGLRMLLGSGVVFLATRVFDRIGYSHKPANKSETKRLWLTGIACGIFLSIASNLQQVALVLGVQTGKAGFLTAVYILLVPIIGIFLHKKCPWNVWAGVAIALVGLYFLCIKGTFSLETADILLLLCALGFSIQIVIIDRFGNAVDSLRLSSIQFLVVGVTTAVPAIIFEVIPYEGGFSAWIMQFASLNNWISILYMAICSCGIAYTLQIVGQKGLNPTIASLIMSLEAVFSLLSGMFFLKQTPDAREIIGCCLMFTSICIAQVNFSRKKI